MRSQPTAGLFAAQQTVASRTPKNKLLSGQNHDKHPLPRHQTREIAMFESSPHKPYHPSQDVPDEFEPGSLPVEPDEGPVPAGIPADPEHDRVVDPEA